MKRKEWAQILDNALRKNKQLIESDLFKNSSLSNYERVERLLADTDSPRLVDEFLADLAESNEIDETKNIDESDQYRKKGNESFCRRDYKPALKFYTLAILNAPDSSESLLLGYSNRSAVFYDLKRYEQCLGDLSRAKSLLSKSKPTRLSERVSLVMKLLVREVNCLVGLKRMVDLEKNEFVGFVRKVGFSDTNAKSDVDTKISELKKRLSTSAVNASADDDNKSLNRTESVGGQQVYDEVSFMWFLISLLFIDFF